MPKYHITARNYEKFTLNSLVELFTKQYEDEKDKKPKKKHYKHSNKNRKVD